MTAPYLPTPEWREDEASQIPALLLLVNLGWQYLTPEEALRARGGRASRVILTDVLTRQLRILNAIRFKGNEYAYSDASVQEAVQTLENREPDTALRVNESVYDLLRLGKSVTQSIDGDLKSFTIRYIDWEHPERNTFHVTEEYSVESGGSTDTRRPDLVLFVNGIPLGVIECKHAALRSDPVREAISQQIRNQRDEYIPRLFWYAQLLLASCPDAVRYGTVGTSQKFWASWKEHLDETALLQLINTHPAMDVAEAIFGNRFRHVRRYFDALLAQGRGVTEQDRALFALCHPDRLLELAHRFVIFDAGEKKIARYQQYFTVKEVLDRIRDVDAEGRRRGGVVWHTQGSGKSLTMVMLATAIAESAHIPQRKVLLVTDRVDLDEQIWGTFQHCGLEPIRARTGRHLAELLESAKHPVVTTVIDKFEASTKTKLRLESRDIFVLVDESHRGQYNTLHTNMRRVLPNACFIGFTGTPVAKKEKNTVEKFGGLIRPVYTINDAVADEAVVRLLYEGRDVPQIVDRDQIDRWFDRITATLTPNQVADLKRKFSSTSQLNKAEQKVAAIAWDASAHFLRNGWKGAFKGQLVAPDKATAILYKKHFDEAGMVSTEVLISAPDDREGDEDVREDNRSEVVKFWRSMVGPLGRFTDEKDYNKHLIQRFKYGDDPDILIVVDKLLTGFDAPRNTVLYLTRKLKEHTLLQAIARVNRVYEGKDFGYVIDYAGVLHGLNEALELYGSLPGFEAQDLEGTLIDVAAETGRLPQLHTDLWAVFASVRNRRDQEEYERLLADEAVRDEFYHALAEFARTAAVAFGSAHFVEHTSEDRVRKYREDLRYFEALRRAVRRRYAEVVDFGDYEPRIQRLLDRHVGTGEVETITPLVDIFNREAFAREVAAAGSVSSKADLIAHRTAKTIRERMEDDPAFYLKFSSLLEQTIAEWRAGRISDAEYLARVHGVADSVTERPQDDLPPAVRYDPVKTAYYGLVRERLAKYEADPTRLEQLGADTAVSIDDIIDSRRVVNWVDNPDVQNRMKTEIEDELFELRDRHGLTMSLDDMDALLDDVLNVARRRKPA
ncbi:MAG: type I restriction endonuclease subunit R [Gemmatimonadetes bacterium]|nr:type I restriction endonuclease subunit R [Gemmatimonadota bacterium]